MERADEHQRDDESAVPPSMMTANGSNPHVGSHAVRSPAEVFAEHCARGQLAYQIDEDGRAVFHPRVGPYEWRVSSGLGTVYATTTVRRRGEEPHDVSLVDLDEGFRMMSTVRGGGRIGMRVRVAFDDGVPVFEPAP
jgi:hypothetical protein